MKEKSNIPQQGSDAVWQLFQLLQQLIGSSMSNCLKDMPGQIVQLSNQLSQVETKQQQSLYDIESVKQQTEKLASMNNLLENASETNHLLGKEHYDEHVIQPIVRSLFPVLDLIEDARKHWSGSEQIIELFNVLWGQMEQFLAIYDVHAVKHAANDEYDPQIMKAISWTPVDDKRLDGCVAESLQTGFQFGEVRMLRLETVSLFKHQASKINSIVLNERVVK